jgi:hypothetical protein
MIPAPGSFASSAFPVLPSTALVPSQNAPARFGSSIPLGPQVPQEMGQKNEKSCIKCNSSAYAGKTRRHATMRDAEGRNTKQVEARPRGLRQGEDRR